MLRMPYVHMILELDDTFVSISMKPGLGASGQEVQSVITHLNHDLSLAPSGADEGQRPLRTCL